MDLVDQLTALAPTGRRRGAPVDRGVAAGSRGVAVGRLRDSARELIGAARSHLWLSAAGVRVPAVRRALVGQAANCGLPLHRYVAEALAEVAAAGLPRPVGDRPPEDGPFDEGPPDPGGTAAAAIEGAVVVSLCAVRHRRGCSTGEGAG